MCNVQFRTGVARTRYNALRVKCAFGTFREGSALTRLYYPFLDLRFSVFNKDRRISRRSFALFK